MTADMHIQKELKDQVHEKSFKRTVCFGNLKMYVSIAMPTKLIGILNSFQDLFKVAARV